jgi:hypothetical protein
MCTPVHVLARANHGKDDRACFDQTVPWYIALPQQRKASPLPLHCAAWPHSHPLLQLHPTTGSPPKTASHPGLQHYPLAPRTPPPPPPSAPQPVPQPNPQPCTPTRHPLMDVAAVEDGGVVAAGCHQGQGAPLIGPPHQVHYQVIRGSGDGLKPG